MQKGMFKTVATSLTVLLFVSVGIGLWDTLRSLDELAICIALTFIISGILDTWAALISR